MKTYKLLTNLLLALLLVLVNTSTSTATTLQIPDGLPIIVQEYQGYRLHITNLELLEKKDNWIKIKFTAVNTGREDISLGIKKLVPIVINFDHDFNASGLSPYKFDIQQGLLKHRMIVKAGQIKDNIEALIMVNKPATIVDKIQPVKEVKTTIPVVKEEEKVTAILTPTPKKEKIKKEEIEKVTRETTKVEKIEKVEIVKKDTEKKEAEESVSVMNPKVEEEKIEIVKKEKPKRVFLDKNNCPDLAIDEIRVIKKSKRWLMLEYTITNHGSAEANLYGKEKGDQDNVAIRANLSGTTKLTRGSLILGGDFVTNAKNKGVLESGKSYKGLMKLDISNMSRYTPVLILELDIYQTVRECDETNNRKHMQLR